MSDYSALFTGKSETAQAPSTHLTPARYRILLVDDEPGILKALQRVFRRENYEIVTAGNGQEALQIFQDQEIHLVISDFMMPGMNGAQLLREIKSRAPDTLRIMLTGHANTDAVMGAVNEGAVYKFIIKPWNDDDLRVTVALALEQFDLIQRNRVLKA
ncbi:MAG: type secretion system protein E:Response regulator receiver:ral secretory system protein, partial [Proteobacteria bacterium]|nr:type secretion system protein E:Response regulator receiver:ral secretory system protein [Pseudomonadota bacterium]